MSSTVKEKDKTVSATLKLRDELLEKERKFDKKDDIFGMSLLSNPGYTSSSRTIMFTSQLRQFTNLVNPQIPYLLTNYERVVGKYSTGYHESDENYEVIAKIPKFKNGVMDDHIYLLFIYDRKHDRYDIILKKNVENLTEKFSYEYNNSVMDTKEVGDEISKGEILYQSRSYDEDMNYRYGTNAKFMYLLTNHTIEDAIELRKGFADTLESTEVEVVKVSCNDNDVFLNIYGNNDNYKCFPDVGEDVNGKIVCAKRRITNSQVLYDMKQSNLRKINFSSDNLFFRTGKVIDINVYCNKKLDEIPDNIFNRQLLEYTKMQQEFYQAVYDQCVQIVESGSAYSADIGYYYKQARDILDPDYKWREENNSVFNNFVIEFTIQKRVPASVGQKITGRYGNKGVISRIVPDDEMPFLPDGTKVDIIFNTLGVVNRLNSQQLFEQSITFICNRVRERFKTVVETHEERKALLLRILWYFNAEESAKLLEYMNELNEEERIAFDFSVIHDGIFVHNPPLWEDEAMFDRLWKLYDEFPWIKPYDVYINRFGRKIKMMRKLIVGDMYIIKLKQTSEKGFSVRSTGSISKRGTPEKSNKVKMHQEMHSKTPIRFGDQENINSAIGVDSIDMAKLHLYYRSSTHARRYLGNELMQRTSTKQLKDFDTDVTFVNVNAQILQMYLKILGLGLNFGNREYISADIGDIQEFEYKGVAFKGTESEFYYFKKEVDIRDKYKGPYYFIGTNPEYEELIAKELAEELAKDERKRNKRNNEHIGEHFITALLPE